MSERLSFWSKRDSQRMHGPLTGFVYAKVDGTWDARPSSSAGGDVVGKTFSNQTVRRLNLFCLRSRMTRIGPRAVSTNSSLLKLLIPKKVKM